MTDTEKVRAALARHRNQAPIGLPLTFPISWQIDADLGKELQKDLYATGANWEVRVATPLLWQQIPSESGLYMFVYKSHLKLAVAQGGQCDFRWVLYVGRAGNEQSSRTLKDRYKGEYCKYIGGSIDNLWASEPNSGRDHMMKRYLCIWPMEYWFLTISDRAQISALEDRLIKLFAPPLNLNGQLRLRKGDTRPAFRSR